MKKIAIIITVLVLSISLKAQVEYIAHRGASNLAPENTLASVKLAWDLGADAAEIDIHLSKDNRLMVIHDYNTRRTSGEDYKIKTTNSEILRKLDVGSFKNIKYKGQKIPFLEEVISLIPIGKKLVVELKSGLETIPAIERVVKNCSKQNQLLFISFNWEAIVKLKEIFPNNKCYWLSGNKSKVLNRLEQISKFNLDGIDVNYSIIDRSLAKRVKEVNLDLVAYTVDKPDEVIRLRSLGVDGITTNKPQWLKSTVNNL